MKMNRSMSLACAAAVAAIVLAPTTAMAAGSPTPPPAVVSSLKPGGTAFEDAVKLSATNEKGGVDVASMSALKTSAAFGSPRLYYYYWEPTSKTSTATTFTDADFYLDRGLRWLAVELKSGSPFSMVEVDNVGATAAVGGWSPETLASINALPADAVIMTDGRYDEAYAISGDRKTITPLSTAAANLVGAKSADATTFRKLKAQQAIDLAAQEEAQNLPADAVGGMPGSSTQSNTPVVALEVAAGAALLAGGAYMIGRRRSNSHHDAAAIAPEPEW